MDLIGFNKLSRELNCSQDRQLHTLYLHPKYDDLINDQKLMLSIPTRTNNRNKITARVISFD